MSQEIIEPTTINKNLKISDSLTSTSVTEALSAKQGKVLKELIDSKASSDIDSIISVDTDTITTAELDYSNVINLKNNNYLSNAKAMSFDGWGSGYGFETIIAMPGNGYVWFRVSSSDANKPVICIKKSINAETWNVLAGTVPSNIVVSSGNYPLIFPVNKGDNIGINIIGATAANKVSIANAIFVPYKEISVVKTYDLRDDFKTTEVVTNKTWTNNKTIYRRVITGNTPNTQNTPTNVADLSSWGIDQLISIEGFIDDSGDWYPLNWSRPNESIDTFYYNSNLRMYVGATDLLNKPFTATIEYTKNS